MVLEDMYEVEFFLKYVYYFKIREGNDEFRLIIWSDIFLNCFRVNLDRIFIIEIWILEAVYGFLDVLNFGYRGSFIIIYVGLIYLVL